MSTKQNSLEFCESQQHLKDGTEEMRGFKNLSRPISEYFRPFVRHCKAKEYKFIKVLLLRL